MLPSGQMWTDFMHAFQAGYSAAMHEASRCQDDTSGGDVTARARLIGQLKDRFGAHASYVYSKAYEDVATTLNDRVTKAAPPAAPDTASGVKTEPSAMP